MIEALLALPAHVRERLAVALESGLIPLPHSMKSLQSVLGNSASAVEVEAALTGFEVLGVSASAAAVWLRTMNRSEARLPRPDMVWSGPEVLGLHARNTRRVYEELLGTAERSVWMSTYAFFDGPRAFETLARRMDAVAGMRAIVLLNIQRKRSDPTAPEHLVRKFADRFWRSDWPGISRPQVFYDPRSLELDGRHGGVLHAKAIVADEEIVFVTSANLTEAALDRNIELGLLARDKALAASISTHFAGLIDRGLLRPLPAD